MNMVITVASFVSYLVIIVLQLTQHSYAFIIGNNHENTRQHDVSTGKLFMNVQEVDNYNDDDCHTSSKSRRQVLGQILNSSLITTTTAASTILLNAVPVNASDDDSSSENDDLTNRMFNEDGSLKSNAMNGLSSNDIEAKSKTVTVLFPSSSSDDDNNEKAIVNVDGNFKSSSSLPSSSSSSQLKTSYQIPEKWTAAPEYLDTLLSVREKACDHIIVYQVPGTFKDNSILEKATTIGVSKALNFASTTTTTVESGVFPKALNSADIISGRKVNKVSTMSGENNNNGDGEKNQRYYEFDLAVAPDTCGQSAENLNLGFCPYDTIVLVSATIVNEKMMVCAVSCNKDMWKRANADLKRVRGGFFVEAPRS